MYIYRTSQNAEISSRKYCNVFFMLLEILPNNTTLHLKNQYAKFKKALLQVFEKLDNENNKVLFRK